MPHFGLIFFASPNDPNALNPILSWQAGDPLHHHIFYEDTNFHERYDKDKISRQELAGYRFRYDEEQ